VKELPRGATVYCSASQAVRRAFPVTKPRSTELRTLRPADLILTLTPTAILLEGCGVKISTPAELAPAKDPSRTAEAAQKLLSRLGDDGFCLRRLTLRDNGLFLPAGLLNATRRAWAEAARERLADEEEGTAPLAEVQIVTPRAPVTTSKYTLKVSALQSPTVLGGEIPEHVVVALTTETRFDDVKPWLDAVPYERLRFALPVALREHHVAQICETVGALLDKGIRKFESADLTSWQLLQDLSPACDALDITADWTWYAINPDAEQRQIACGITGNVSGPEANLPNLKDLPSVLPKEILVLQYAPQFIAFTQPHAKSDLLLTRESRRLRITRNGAQWITFDERPWSAQAHVRELMKAGFDTFRIDLSWAGAKLPVKTWREALAAPDVIEAHFSDHRL
jgi:hypothetical protein